MPRLLRTVILVVSLLAVVSLVTTVPDLGALAVEKITEGGMWTALAVFILAAIVLGARRRGAAGSPPRPGDEPR